jgi:putative glutamine amidotransferase
MIDGLVLSGGSDVDPHYFGEEPHPKIGNITPERDKTEFLLTKAMLKRNKPILAICRGIQILNVAAGGKLYQDIASQYEGELIQHSQKAPRSYLAHSVQVTPGSLLAKSAGSESFRVNTFHHQAVSTVAPGFEVTAVASDGIIEGIESADYHFALGVQWHPESSYDEDIISRNIFAAFIKACKEK